MEKQTEQLSPKDSFSVQIAQGLGVTEFQSLYKLYQPILGMRAVGIYQALLGEIEQEERLHSYLLTICNLGVFDWYKERLRLEGIGLLKTFVKKDEHGAKHVLYQLQHPYQPDVFFRDDILSLMLYEIIGKVRYEQLTRELTGKTEKPDGYEETTARFDQVFQFSPEKLVLNLNQLDEARQQITTGSKQQLQIANAGFDWEFFLSQLRKSFFPASQLSSEDQQVILFLAGAYGFDELVMMDFVLDTYDENANKLDIKLLKQHVYQTYHEHHPQPVTPSAKSDQAFATKEEASTYRKNSLLMEGFSEEEVQVIHACEEIPPLAFLKMTKEKLGGFVANSERTIVTNLMQRSHLPASVINVLIHYLLVIQQKPMIYQNTADQIANDWARKKVHTPENAIKRVQEFIKEKADKEKKQSTRSFYPRQNAKKESLPEWVDQNITEKAVTKQVEADLNERIQKLKERRKGGS